jgi:hypothetical protein
MSIHKIVLFLTLIFVIAIFNGCGESGERQLSAQELINNPNTANPDADPDKPQPKLVFEEPEFDFGTVNEGDKVQHTFRFKNTGSAPLLISKASASCGCTVPSFPKSPIDPGKSGEIDVVFDTKGKGGNQIKVVTISANTNPGQTEISLRGVVAMNAENKNQ